MSDERISLVERWSRAPRIDNDTRTAIAEAAGLPAQLADRLRGATDAELRADAAALAHALNPTRPEEVHTMPNSNGDDSDVIDDPIAAHRAATDGIYRPMTNDHTDPDEDLDQGDPDDTDGALELPNPLEAHRSAVRAAGWL